MKKRLDISKTVEKVFGVLFVGGIFAIGILGFLMLAFPSGPSVITIQSSGFDPSNTELFDSTRNSACTVVWTNNDY